MDDSTILYVTDGSSKNRWQPFYKKSDRGIGFSPDFLPVRYVHLISIGSHYRPCDLRLPVLRIHLFERHAYGALRAAPFLQEHILDPLGHAPLDVLVLRVCSYLDDAGYEC